MGYVLVSLLLHETYFSPDPGINTYFSSGYTEEGFNQIQTGDSKERVLELVGKPLMRCEPPRDCSNSVWTYAYQSETFDLFAWFYRELQFDSDDKVQEIRKEVIHHDIEGQSMMRASFRR
jgi:outer membrane protein assembly factor BamE (lipoprotein component of BamABCDE complex)